MVTVTSENAAPENFRDWITPPKAVELLTPKFPQKTLAISTLTGRLRSGMMRGIAETLVATGPVPENKASFIEVPKKQWDDVKVFDDFWAGADLIIVLLDQFRQRVIFNYYNVRFEPSGIETILGAPIEAVASAVAPSTIAGDTHTAPQFDRTKDVSPDALKAWYELYKTQYPDNNADHAWASALGMFPDKKVTRKKIRDLRGAREMGRPKSEE